MVALLSIFWGTSILFSIVAAQFTFLRPSLSFVLYISVDVIALYGSLRCPCTHIYLLQKGGKMRVFSEVFVFPLLKKKKKKSGVGRLREWFALSSMLECGKICNQAHVYWLQFSWSFSIIYTTFWKIYSWVSLTRI